jgi:FixJ family two-component response regulator
MSATNRLLIVDDEPGIAQIIEVVARELDFDVLAIHNTDQFEKALEDCKPTVIFLDISMPRRDGLELVGLLSARNYPGKIVIMSGTDPVYIQMTETIAKTRGLWVVGTLAKPFRKQAISDVLRSLTTGILSLVFSWLCFGNHPGLT